MKSCSMPYTIRQYRAEDEGEVVVLWNLCMPRDEIMLNTFRRKIILDANFDPQGCFVALGRRKIVGFLLSISRRYPYFDVGLEPELGWITAFFVHPEWRRQSIAATMLGHAERFLAQTRVK
jgi:mycothiol synthase